jgi:nitroimidazol reductase NimA-like FMN-containing flavoprotein (pyridoxamine 5'-phosphate oxidase superfamily)
VSQQLYAIDLSQKLVVAGLSTIKNGLREMEEILRRAEVGRMAICQDNMPYIIPLNFLYHKGKIIFHCAWEGEKLDIIKKNPNSCFEVDEFTGKIGDHYEARCHLSYDSILAFGKARIENHEQEKIEFLQLFAEKYSESYRKPLSKGGKRFDKTRVSECCCVVIDLEELTGRRERKIDGKTNKKLWHHKF